MSFEEIVGHSKQIKILKTLYKAEGPHCLILTGKKGIGRKSIAIEICKLINDENKKINRGTFKDLQYFGPKYDESNVFKKDSIRKVIEQSYLNPIEGNYKVFILDEVEKFHPGAGEAFLKILEEPPPSNIYILILDDIKNIIGTIKSRSIHIHLNDLSTEEVLQYLEKNYLNNKNNNLIANLADGSIGLAQDIVKYDLLDIRNKFYKDIILKLDQINLNQLLKIESWEWFPDEWNKIEKIKFILTFIKTIMLDLVSLSRIQSQLINKDLDLSGIKKNNKKSQRILNSIYEFESRLKPQMNYQLHALNFWLKFYELQRI